MVKIHGVTRNEAEEDTASLLQGKAFLFLLIMILLMFYGKQKNCPFTQRPHVSVSFPIFVLISTRNRNERILWTETLSHTDRGKGGDLCCKIES